MNSREKMMENKERVVVKYDGMKFTFAIGAQEIDCNECQAFNWCYVGSPIGVLCCGKYHCTSATKIEGEAKVYGPGTSKGAIHLIGKNIEYWDGEAGWVGPFELSDIDHNAYNTPYRHTYGCHGTRKWSGAIREIKPETITLTEARERFNIPDNVIVEGE